MHVWEDGKCFLFLNYIKIFYLRSFTSVVRDRKLCFSKVKSFVLVTIV